MEIFAGKDLLSVYTESLEKGIERRSTLQAKLSSMRDIRPLTQSATEGRGTSDSGGPSGTGADAPVGKGSEGGPEKGVEAKNPAAEVTDEPGVQESKGEVKLGEKAAEKEGDSKAKEDVPTHNAFCDACAVCSNFRLSRLH